MENGEFMGRIKIREVQKDEMSEMRERTGDQKRSLRK